MSHKLPQHLNRRTFLGTGLAAGSLLGAATQARAAAPRPIDLPRQATFLFQGDSITDVHRDRQATAANDRGALGGGYPFLLAGALRADHPELDLQVYNRGISGNKVPDLEARWQTDTLALRPQVLSILIGVNDIWHKLNGNYEGTAADYETGYRTLIQRTLRELPGVRLVLCEPFVLRCGAVTDQWFPEFSERLEAARRLAAEFSLPRVPFQSMFDEAVESAPPEYWAADGVHPSLAGHALMAQTWRRITGW